MMPQPGNLSAYDGLVEALRQPLPNTADGRDQLRQMVTFAESFGIIVSEHRRYLLAKVENVTADRMTWLKGGGYWDENGQQQSEEYAEAYRKLNADEKNIMLKAEISTYTAELDFVTNLESLIKRRCSLGQTISNSFNMEASSQLNT